MSMNKDLWNLRMLIFWYLRAKSNGFKIEPFDDTAQTNYPSLTRNSSVEYDPDNPERVLTPLRNAWRDWVRGKISSYLSILDIKDGFIDQKEWDALKEWLQNNKIDSFNISEWDVNLLMDEMGEILNLEQVIGWELATFVEFSGFDLWQGDDHPDATPEEKAWAEEEIERRLFEDFEFQKKLILLSSDFQDYCSKAWSLLEEDLTEKNEQIDFFLNYLEKKGISQIDCHGIGAGEFLYLISLLKQSPHQFVLQDRLLSMFGKQLIFLVNQLGFDRLIFQIYRDDEEIGETKKALLMEKIVASDTEKRVALLRLSSDLWVDEAIPIINKYDLTFCLSVDCNQHGRELLIKETPLRWVSDRGILFDHDFGSKEIKFYCEALSERLDREVICNIDGKDFTHKLDINEASKCIESFENQAGRCLFLISNGSIAKVTHDQLAIREFVFDPDFWLMETSVILNRSKLPVDIKYLGDFAAISWGMDLSKDEIVKKGNIAIIDEDCIDGLRINFEKVKHYIKDDNKSKQQTISDSALLGLYISYDGDLPELEFIHYDPRTSPFKEIVVGKGVMVIRPRTKDVSSGFLLGYLNDCFFEARHQEQFKPVFNAYAFYVLSSNGKLNEMASIPVFKSALEDQQRFIDNPFPGDFPGDAFLAPSALGSFLGYFGFKDSLKSTFDSFQSFLKGYLCIVDISSISINGFNVYDSCLPKVELLITTDLEKLLPFTEQDVSDHLNFRVNGPNDVALLIWGKNKPQGVIKIHKDNIGKRTFDIGDLARLAGFVWETWHKISNSIIEFTGSALAHESATPFANIENSLDLALKYLNQPKEVDVRKLKDQIKGAQDGLRFLQSFSDRVRDFQKAKAQGVTTRIHIKELIKQIARGREVIFISEDVVEMIVIDSYPGAWEIILKIFIDNASANSLDGISSVNFEKDKGGRCILSISNKVRPTFSPIIMDYFGKQQLESTTGGSGIGAFIACRILDNLGFEWFPGFDDQSKLFSINIVLKEIVNAQ